ncbi:hypothetical protein BHM03_00056737 [Ensete ventricosum]|nr:hypothetical protein BHM03_00056737 [Ensete ventricosum]
MLCHRLAFKLDELGLEIMGIAFPAALALMADPIASLIDTAFIGPVELAAVGVSIAVFNQVSRIAIFPLVSVTTSFVAEEDAVSKSRSGDPESGEHRGLFSEEDSEMKELITHSVDVLPPSIKDLQFGRFLKNGLLLLARVIAVTFCVTLAASLAARQGSIPMAAFQICLQIWLATSLLADGLAVAGQVRRHLRLHVLDC